MKSEGMLLQWSESAHGQHIVTDRYVAEPTETAAIGSALITNTVFSTVFSSVSLYNESYFAYYEDTDICVRARATGFKILIVPQARYHHYPATSVRRVQGLRDFVSVRNRFIFVRSTQSPFARMQFFITHPISLVKTAGFWAVSRSFADFRTAILGYIAGMAYFLRGRDSKSLNAVAEVLLGHQVVLDG